MMPWEARTGSIPRSLSFQEGRKRSDLKKALLKIWRILPPWMQGLASAIIRMHYQVAAGAIIFNDQGQILLCEHTYRLQYPWGLPGGGIQFGEDPADAVRRELWEETGFSVKEIRLLQVENSTEDRRVLISFLCTGVSGDFVPNEEVSAVRYFDLEALPPLNHEQQATIARAISILKNKRENIG